MQFIAEHIIAEDFAERFDEISQFLVNRSGIDYKLVVISSQKKQKFLQECLDDLNKCKNLNDFRQLTKQHYIAANGFHCIENIDHSSSKWQKQLRHLQKYHYFLSYDYIVLNFFSYNYDELHDEE